MKNYLNQIGKIDDSYVKLAQQNYERARSNSLKQERQRISGKTYVGKTTKTKEFSNKAKLAILTIGLAGMIVITNNVNTVLDYQTETNKVEKELLPEAYKQAEFNNYQNVQSDNIITSIKSDIDTLNQISNEKKILKDTGNYSIFDSNQLHDDAIRNVAVENTNAEIAEMNEYMSRGAK